MTLIAVAAIKGAPVDRAKRNSRRLNLLKCIINDLPLTHARGELGALLLPAGFLRSKLQLGPLGARARALALEQSPLGEALKELAIEADARGCGALVIGVDTKPYDGFGGDQLLVAWGAKGVLALARKVFPSVLDTNGEEKPPYLVFERDADDPWRILTLGDGTKAMLGVCYDAFGWVDCVLGGTSKRAATEFLYDPVIGWRYSTREELRSLAIRQAAILSQRDHIGLVAIHGFKRPGRDTYWQRHGIAAASAALGGRLVVGAAHYKSLPAVRRLTRGTLAARDVPRAHLGQGLRRQAHYEPALAAFGVLSGDGLAAVIRTFEI
jgi:hypothetical protein